jgi:hypothetical protein
LFEILYRALFFNALPEFVVGAKTTELVKFTGTDLDRHLARTPDEVAKHWHGSGPRE